MLRGYGLLYANVHSGANARSVIRASPHEPNALYCGVTLGYGTTPSRIGDWCLRNRDKPKGRAYVRNFPNSGGCSLKHIRGQNLTISWDWRPNIELSRYLRRGGRACAMLPPYLADPAPCRLAGPPTMRVPTYVPPRGSVDGGDASTPVVCALFTFMKVRSHVPGISKMLLKEDL